MCLSTLWIPFRILKEKKLSEQLLMIYQLTLHTDVVFWQRQFIQRLSEWWGRLLLIVSIILNRFSFAFILISDLCELVSNVTTQWKSWLWSRGRRSYTRSVMASSSISVRSFSTLSGIIRLPGHHREESDWPKICTPGLFNFHFTLLILILMNFFWFLAVGTFRFGRSSWTWLS